MLRLLTLLIGLAGCVPLLLAFSTLLGLGVLRHLPIPEVVALALGVAALPVLGMGLIFGGRGGGMAAASWIWPMFLLYMLPRYFPTEATDALSTGLSILAVVGGDEWMKGASALADRVYTAPPPAPAPVAAAKVVPDCKPVAAAPVNDHIALPYEGQGHSLSIPVIFGDTEVQMLFDTGATFTTLDRQTLRALGVRIPPDAPEVTMRTANGERVSQLVLIDEVWLGGFVVKGVTVGVCDECASDQTVGLLGLNVSGQFLVTVDTARKEVVFEQRAATPDRVVDVTPWLDVSATGTSYPDGRVEVEIAASNNARRAVSSAEIGVMCDGQSYAAPLSDIDPGQTVTTQVRLPRASGCDRFTFRVERAQW